MRVSSVPHRCRLSIFADSYVTTSSSSDLSPVIAVPRKADRAIPKLRPSRPDQPFPYDTPHPLRAKNSISLPSSPTPASIIPGNAQEQMMMAGVGSPMTMDSRAIERDGMEPKNEQDGLNKRGEDHRKQDQQDVKEQQQLERGMQDKRVDDESDWMDIDEEDNDEKHIHEEVVRFNEAQKQARAKR